MRLLVCGRRSQPSLVRGKSARAAGKSIALYKVGSFLLHHLDLAHNFCNAQDSYHLDLLILHLTYQPTFLPHDEPHIQLDKMATVMEGPASEYTPSFAPFFGMVGYSTWFWSRTKLTLYQAGIASAVCLCGYLLSRLLTNIWHPDDIRLYVLCPHPVEIDDMKILRDYRYRSGLWYGQIRNWNRRCRNISS